MELYTSIPPCVFKTQNLNVFLTSMTLGTVKLRPLEYFVNAVHSPFSTHSWRKTFAESPFSAHLISSEWQNTVTINIVMGVLPSVLLNCWGVYHLSCWIAGVLTICSVELLVCLSSVLLNCWCAYHLYCWTACVLIICSVNCWCAYHLYCWTAGVLIICTVEWLVCLSSVLLNCWCAYHLFCWTAGVLIICTVELLVCLSSVLLNCWCAYHLYCWNARMLTICPVELLGCLLYALLNC
jgi:hypothetical protein